MAEPQTGWASLIRRATQRLWHMGFLLTRPMTLGVRVVAIKGEDEIFLIRHSYVPGWHLPGGGVDPGETCLAAMARELAEETPLRATGPAHLHGIFFNSSASRRDHVAVYIVRDFTIGPPRPADYEISEGGFFNRAALPEDVSAGTRRRLAEIFDHSPLNDHW